MTIKLYDLCGRDDRRFSPYCWRARMALAHKGLGFDAIPTRFTEIKDIAGGGHGRIPVIDHDGTVVADSWAIAVYLEETFPDAPGLFKGEGGMAAARFIEGWANGVLIPAVAPLIVKDIHDIACDEDRDYFRQSRESRFGKTLEDVQAGREERLEFFRGVLMPLRLMLRSQPFIGGESPLYTDYMVFATLQFPRVASPFALLDAEDPVHEWFERCLDLHDGLGRAMPAAV